MRGIIKPRLITSLAVDLPCYLVDIETLLVISHYTQFHYCEDDPGPAKLNSKTQPAKR